MVPDMILYPEDSDTAGSAVSAARSAQDAGAKARWDSSPPLRSPIGEWQHVVVSHLFVTPVELLGVTRQATRQSTERAGTGTHPRW